MELPLFKPTGTPVEELDTPALVVDLSAMEHNIEVLHSFFRDRPAKVRPHIKVHKCPPIAHQQLAAGGTVGGICTAKVGEAEVFAQAGFGDILVANEIVTRPKIARLCALAHSATIAVAVDNPQNVDDLSEAAQAHGVTLRVLVDINTRLDRCGVEPGQPALDLAQAVARAPGLHFAGLMTYEGGIRHESYEDLVLESKKWIQMVLDTREMVEREGLPVEMVSVGGTHNYEIAGAMDGVTEVQAATYVLMDHTNLPYRRQFQLALKVMATVVSHPIETRAIVDAGHKAIGPDRGFPLVDSPPGVKVKRLSAEHAILELEGEAQRQLDLGAKVWLTPFDLELCTNQYDYIQAVRDGKLVATWEITARGRWD